jgi:GTPase Era involved in 16S rRNA processing
MKWIELEPKTVALKNALVSIIENIQANQADNLPKIEPVLNLSLDLLKKPSYDIVVCGEVKKGKSTFINAIIGQEILPTDTQVATSQVFRITNSETESFELVFIDGSAQKVSREELSRYGCQVDANLLGEAQFTGKVLDYIQVNIPVEFLPEGVSIVDTPGLGALYAAHEQITNRYVKNAAAVLFVFDPANPMVKQEKEFLDRVFDVTPYVMFIMTKIDNHSEEYVVDMIRRNEDLLKIYEDKCYTSPKVFPVASRTLADATAAEDDTLKEVYYNASLFPEAKEELLRLIYKTVGLSRNTFAFSEAGKQAQKTCSFIKEQIAMVTEGNQKEKEEIKRKRTELSDWINKTWGASSTKRKEIFDEINAIGVGVQNRTQEILSSNGRIFNRYADEIKALTSKEEAETFAKALPERIKNEVSSTWQEVLTTAQTKLKELLGEYKSDMDQMLTGKCPDLDIIPLSSPIELMGLSGKDKFACFRSSYMDAGISAGIGGFLLSLVGISLATPVLGVVVGLGVLLWGFLGGTSAMQERELQGVKAKLNTGLSSGFAKIRESLLITPVQNENLSPVQKFVSNLKEVGEVTMKSIYEDKFGELKQEDKRLEEQQKMEYEQKQKIYAKLNEQQKAWNKIGLNLQTSQALLQEVIKLLN